MPGITGRAPKPVPPEHKPLYDLLWEVMRCGRKLNRNGARVLYPQAIRAGAQRLFQEGWRVTERPHE